MSGIPGLRGTGDWGPDERPKSFREMILFLNPNGTAPIFALSGKAGKKVESDPEFSWWCEGQNMVRLQVNGALSASDTTVTVDSVDPTATTLGAMYGTATHLKPGDILLVEPATDNATFDHELVRVESVLSDTQFTVARGVGGTSAAVIGNDAYLLLIGSAYGEGTDAPTAVSRNPIKFSNFTQIFKDAYELTRTAEVTETRTGDPWSNDKKRKSFDHARSIEMSLLFGRKQETTDANGKPLRYMGGIRSFIPTSRTTVFSSAVSAATLLDAIEPVFDFDTEGGDTRVVFAGNAAMIELGKVIQNETAASMELGSTITQWGMKFQELITPRGRLLFKSHPLLSQHAIYKNSAFVLDFSSIKYVHLKGRDTKPHDDVQAKSEDVRRGYYLTECSLMVDRGGLTCGYLGKISAT